MSDNLKIRCLAEVVQVMLAEPHSAKCQRLIGGSAMSINRPGTEVRCTCDRDHRLASRVAQMLAAGIQTAGTAKWYGATELRERPPFEEAALRAVAQAREAV